MADGPFQPVVVDAGAGGLSLAWQAPEYIVTPYRAGEQWYSQIEMAPLPRSAQPGRPQLPFYSGLIGLPVSGGASVRLIEVEQTTIFLPHPPLSAPMPQPVDFSLANAQMLSAGSPTVFYSDEAIYNLDAFYPANVVHLEEPQQLRHHRVARLTINPVQVNPVTRQMRVTHFLRLEIIFDRPVSMTRPLILQPVQTASFDRALAENLLNPEAIYWPSPELKTEKASVSKSVERSPTGSLLEPLIKVVVSEAGLHALTYDDLSNAGLAVDTLDPRTLQLSHGSDYRPVAILVEGEAGGRFDPQDRLFFYAEPEFSRFGAEDVYFLGYGQTSGLRMNSRSGDPAEWPAGTAWVTSSAEENHHYVSLYRGRNGDYWYWAELKPPDNTEATLTIQLEQPFGKVLKKYDFEGEMALSGPPNPPGGGNLGHYQDDMGPKLTKTSPFGGLRGPIHPPNYSTSDFLSTLFGGSGGASTPQLDIDPQATLTLWLQGRTDDQHTVAVSINEVDIGQTTWSGDEVAETTFSFAPTLLQDGENQVALSLPGLSGTVEAEGVLLDAMMMTYPSRAGGSNQLRFSGQAGQKSYSLGGWSEADLLVFDITEVYTPAVVIDYTVTLSGDNRILNIGDHSPTPARYLVVPATQVKAPLALEPANLLTDPLDGADYIIITHPDFAEAITPLAEHRANQGLRVVTVDVQAIYDTYGGGRVSPEAIKAFLQHAYDTWTPPAPLYVLLVGDGHYDFKNHQGYNAPNFIPPYLAEVDPWLVETAADNRYVTLTGDDPFPDMLIGRLPVNSAAEVETVVGKIIHSQTNPYPGGWNAHHLLVSDDPDHGGDFYQEADWVYDKLPDSLQGFRFYYNSNSGNAFDSTHIYTNVEELRETFLTRFNRGASLITFHGHSSWHQWGVEQFLRWDRDPALNDIVGLQNGYRLPVMVEMTCFTGYFHHPEYPTLDESLLTHSGGGSVAAWGATGLGIGTGHHQLQAGFYEAVIDREETNLGAAILSGKLKLYESGFHQDLLDTFTLLGDPAFNLNFTVVPFSDYVYLPLILR